MKWAAVVVAAALLVSCRTGRPDGVAIAPLTATTSEEAMQQLRARRTSFDGLRSLMRVRATTNGKTQSFRAQLAIQDARRMELTAYTPVGTTALTLKANGEEVSVQNRIENSEWKGSANDLARSFGFLGAGLTPAEMAMLITGIPPRDDVQYEVDAAGLRRAAFGDLLVVFDPPSFPAKHVVVTRGQDRVEIEHLETVR
jgi:outer membrane biogenesis lipoprotein LolB